MIEFVINVLCIIIILIFWFFIFRQHKPQPISDTPCVSATQHFTDPYGIIYKCDNDLNPVPLDHQPTIDYDGFSRYFKLSTHTLESYPQDDKDESVMNYISPGLEPIPFTNYLKPPFKFKSGKILRVNECTYKADGERIELPFHDANSHDIDFTRGTPFGVCENGVLDRIEYCPPHHDFEFGRCLLSMDPCYKYPDGTILDASDTQVSYCFDNMLQTKSCSHDETLDGLTCVYTPCKFRPDGTILKVDESKHSYTVCQNGRERVVSCLQKDIPTETGCISFKCDQNGLFYWRSASGPFRFVQYAVKCLDGEMTFLRGSKDMMLYTIFAWTKPEFADYYPFVENDSLFYTDVGWESVLSKNVSGDKSIYVTFAKRKIKPGVFDRDFIRVRYDKGDGGKVTVHVLDDLYFPRAVGDNVSTHSHVIPIRQVLSHLKHHGFKLVVMGWREYYFLDSFELFNRQTCKEDEFVVKDADKIYAHKSDVAKYSNEEYSNLMARNVFSRLDIETVNDEEVITNYSVFFSIYGLFCHDYKNVDIFHDKISYNNTSKPFSITFLDVTVQTNPNHTVKLTEGQKNEGRMRRPQRHRYLPYGVNAPCHESLSRYYMKKNDGDNYVVHDCKTDENIGIMADEIDEDGWVSTVDVLRSSKEDLVFEPKSRYFKDGCYIDASDGQIYKMGMDKIPYQYTYHNRYANLVKSDRFPVDFFTLKDLKDKHDNVIPILTDDVKRADEDF